MGSTATPRTAARSSVKKKPRAVPASSQRAVNHLTMPTHGIVFPSQPSSPLFAPPPPARFKCPNGAPRTQPLSPSRPLALSLSGQGFCARERALGREKERACRASERKVESRERGPVRGPCLFMPCNLALKPYHSQVTVKKTRCGPASFSLQISPAWAQLGGGGASYLLASSPKSSSSHRMIR